MLFLLPDAPYPHMKVQLLFFRLSAQFSVFFPTFVKYSRQEYPNAYLPWTGEDDLELTRIWCEGATEEELSAHFRRKPGAPSVPASENSTWSDFTASTDHFEKNS